nr:Cation efflux system protein CusB precursor [Klebsiella pneumoniae]
MASLKIKYAAIIISSLIAGGLISVTARQYVNSSQKTVQTEQKAPERKVLFWYDPMKPDTKFDKPGKSPFMDMDRCQNMLMKAAIKAVAGSVSIQRRFRIWD